MSSHHSPDPWQRLVAAARLAPDQRAEGAPYGFPTRVAALAMAGRGPRGSLMDRFALRALGVASLLALASILINYSSISAPTPSASDDQPVAAEDPMTVLLDA